MISKPTSFHGRVVKALVLSTNPLYRGRGFKPHWQHHNFDNFPHSTDGVDETKALMNFYSLIDKKMICSRRVSIPRPSAHKTDALPTAPQERPCSSPRACDQSMICHAWFFMLTSGCAGFCLPRKRMNLSFSLALSLPFDNEADHDMDVKHKPQWRNG